MTAIRHGTLTHRAASHDGRGEVVTFRAMAAVCRLLLNAELQAARALGRSADAGAFETELRVLEVSPSSTLLARVCLRSADGGAQPLTVGRVLDATRTRLAELRAELHKFGRGSRPAVTAAQTVAAVTAGDEWERALALAD